MARDHDLEQLIMDDLGSIPGLTRKAMFGGLAWLLHGKLLCGAREDGMLVRLGAGNEEWTQEVAGIGPMISRGKPMRGWIRAKAEAFEDVALRQRLLADAVAFVSSLPQ
jgi:TfoX N-terminal domain